MKPSRFRHWPRSSYRFAFLWRIGYFDQMVFPRPLWTRLRINRIIGLGCLVGWLLVGGMESGAW